jgi:hypothetical protein
VDRAWCDDAAVGAPTLEPTQAYPTQAYPTQAQAPRERAGDDEEETYCPACLCARLEDHQAFAGDDGGTDWRGDVFVPVGLVVTKGMLAGTAVPHFCAHHCRALVTLEVAGDLFGTNQRQRESVLGLIAYVERLIERVRTQRQRRDGQGDGGDAWEGGQAA